MIIMLILIFRVLSDIRDQMKYSKNELYDINRELHTANEFKKIELESKGYIKKKGE